LVRTATAIKQENGKDASVLAVAATLTCGTNALRASYKRSSSSGLGVLGASRKNEALRCYGRLPGKTQDVFACDRLGIARQVEIGAVWRAHSLRPSRARRNRGQPLRPRPARHRLSRSWHGWHRHVSLVMLAFVMMTRPPGRSAARSPQKEIATVMLGYDDETYSNPGAGKPGQLQPSQHLSQELEISP
jgi:hypothetical protein